MRKAVVVKIYNDLGELLLLFRRSSPMGFGLPGGKTEKRDRNRPKHTGCREVFEETSLLIKTSNLVHVKDEMSESGETLVSIYEHLDNSSISKQTIKLSDEHSGYIWVKEKDLNNIKLAGNTLNFL